MGCQIATPVLIMLCLTFLQFLVKLETAGLSEDEPRGFLIESLPYSLDVGTNFVADPFLGMERKRVGKECMEYYLFADDTESGSDDEIGHLGSNGAKAGLLGHIKQNACSQQRHDGGTEKAHHPSFAKRSTRVQIESEIHDGLSELNGFPMNRLGEEPYPSYLVADGSVVFREVNASTQRLAYDISTNDNFLVAYHRPNGISRPNLPKNFTLDSLTSTGFSMLGSKPACT